MFWVRVGRRGKKARAWGLRVGFWGLDTAGQRPRMPGAARQGLDPTTILSALQHHLLLGGPHHHSSVPCFDATCPPIRSLPASGPPPHRHVQLPAGTHTNTTSTMLKLQVAAISAQPPTPTPIASPPRHLSTPLSTRPSHPPISHTALRGCGSLAAGL